MTTTTIADSTAGTSNVQMNYGREPSVVDRIAAIENPELAARIRAYDDAHERMVFEWDQIKTTNTAE